MTKEIYNIQRQKLMDDAQKLLDGTTFKPRRLYTVPNSDPLAVFVTDAARVGVGKIQGGWEYVYTCYVITWVGIALYSVSLWARRPKE